MRVWSSPRATRRLEQWSLYSKHFVVQILVEKSSRPRLLVREVQLPLEADFQLTQFDISHGLADISKVSKSKFRHVSTKGLRMKPVKAVYLYSVLSIEADKSVS